MGIPHGRAHPQWSTSNGTAVASATRAGSVWEFDPRPGATTNPTRIDPTATGCRSTGRTNSARRKHYIAWWCPPVEATKVRRGSCVSGTRSIVPRHPTEIGTHRRTTTDHPRRGRTVAISGTGYECGSEGNGTSTTKRSELLGPNVIGARRDAGQMFQTARGSRQHATTMLQVAETDLWIGRNDKSGT